MNMLDGVIHVVRILLFTASGGLIGLFVEWCMRKKYDSKSIWNILIPTIVSLLLAIRFIGYMTIIKGIILLMILLWASNSDIHTHEAANELSVMIAICGLIEISEVKIPTMLAGAFLCALPQIIISVIRPKLAIGGADIKISAACGFLLGVTLGIIGLIIGLTLSVIINLIKRRNRADKLPLIPYLAAGFMAAYFI